MPIKALALTILVSIIFFIGMLIPRLCKNRTKLIDYSTSLTFVIMLFLIFFDLIPEINDILEPFKNVKNFILIILFSGLGFLLLKLLDMFIPEHHHEHHDNEKNITEHNEHVFHIGFITAMSLIIHNILEGISIFITGLNDFKLGFMMALSVGIHNLPLGIEVAVGIGANKSKKITKYVITILLLLSSWIGAFVVYIFNLNLSGLVEGALMSITLGMLIYIAFAELSNEVWQNIKHKSTLVGIIIGLVVSIILLVL